MIIAVGSDHRGFNTKARLIGLLNDLGHQGIDCGTDSAESVDYPDFAAKVAQMVSQGQAHRGILICGTGIGMCITANKFAGVRACTCHDEMTARLSRQHNDTNVLCLSADLLGERVMNRLVEIWLATEFESGRHARRLEKIAQYESRTPPGSCSSTPGCP
ncbi:MAG TPA: ribose 5-phosphate isomerase B [Planctomycetaceae bacterium]|jgi:ribose 5-phosphate isomerase B|nr:ribose 5-phosphate isomerase B [Planctomycetaceae bacterium]